MTDYATLVFQFGHDSLHRLRSYCGETARRSIRPNFSVHPVGKTIRWLEKWITAFLMASTSSITMQSLGKIVQSAPAVGAKMWCLSLCFLSVTLRVRSAVRSRGALNTHCVAVYWPISTRLTAFFPKRLLFHTRYTALTFVARWRHNFREIAVKNCEKSKNRRRKLCAPLRIHSWRIWKKILLP